MKVTVEEGITSSILLPANKNISKTATQAANTGAVVNKKIQHHLSTSNEIPNFEASMYNHLS